MNLKGFRAEVERLEKEKSAEIKNQRKSHKCNNCPWGTFINDKKVVCSFSNCIKEKL